MGGGGHLTVMDPKTQLEAVKFLCKGESRLSSGRSVFLPSYFS
jgi:hypothetical protein